MPSASVVKLGGVAMAVAPWIVSDKLWELVEPLLPVRERRFRYPGRKRLPDREALQGILFVLHTGISWPHLPLELGFGSGVTCWPPSFPGEIEKPETVLLSSREPQTEKMA